MSVSKICTRCKNLKTLSFFLSDKTRVDGFSKWCSECLKIYQKEYREKNKQKIKEKGSLYYKSNKEKIAQKNSKRYTKNKEKILEKNAEWVNKNKDRVKKYRSVYAKEKKDKYAATNMKRYAEKKKRTPRWLDEDGISMIKEIYAMARLQTEKTGIPHHVDHIIPLQGKTVSGFHVPENLQVISYIENSRKRNKYDEWGSNA